MGLSMQSDVMPATKIWRRDEIGTAEAMPIREGPFRVTQDTSPRRIEMGAVERSKIAEVFPAIAPRAAGTSAARWRFVHR